MKHCHVMLVGVFCTLKMNTFIVKFGLIKNLTGLTGYHLNEKVQFQGGRHPRAQSGRIDQSFLEGLFEYHAQAFLQPQSESHVGPFVLAKFVWRLTGFQDSVTYLEMCLMTLGWMSLY